MTETNCSAVFLLVNPWSSKNQVEVTKPARRNHGGVTMLGAAPPRLSPIRFNDSLQSLFEEGDGLAIGVCRDFWIGSGQAVLSAGDAQ
jgi:hypothetical protein